MHDFLHQLVNLTKASCRLKWWLILSLFTAFSVLGVDANAQNTVAKSQNNYPPQTDDFWEADLGNGSYRNPILHADYSDPDVIRVGAQYYMTASSFNSAPGLPLLQSNDMIHWKLVGHALPNLVPAEMFAKPQHGKGVWAPSLRFHAGKFWIFYPDPDVGIYVITAETFAGPWTTPHLLLAGKGYIDPTPLWDDDGKAWLLHAWAKSRAGFNNQLTLRQMAPDGSTLLDQQGVLLIDGNRLPGYKTLEGPKFYKHHGWYYIFAPAGGVETGWQSVFRARHILGPYEDKIVLAQGNSAINGPHQGAWVRAADGSDWFYHFQDRKAYGRIVHLQPMRWLDDWPAIGMLNTTTGIGEPVTTWPSPDPTSTSHDHPATSDEFAGHDLGRQWQWNANWQSDWYSLTAHPRHLRLFSQAWNSQHNLAYLPSLLLQKIPAPNITVETSLSLSAGNSKISAGLALYGQHYRWAGLQRDGESIHLVLVDCADIFKQCKDNTMIDIPLQQATLYLRLEMKEYAEAQFFYSLDGRSYQPLGSSFTAAAGRWVGAKLGLFSLLMQDDETVTEAATNSKSNPNPSPNSALNFADFTTFRVKVSL